MEWIKSQGWKVQTGNTVNGTVTALYSDCICGEQSIRYRLAELLCYIPETSVTLDVNYTHIKKFF